MSSLDWAYTRNLLAKGDIRQCTTDTPIAIRLHYIGTGTITSVTVTTATNIVMITSDGGTDTYAFSAYTTVGALVDAINADGIFEAKVLDTVRSEATASQFVDGVIAAASEGGVSYYNVTVDTSAADYFAVRLTFDRGFQADKLKDKHRIHLQEIKYLIDLGTVAVDGVKIYDIDGTTETLLYSILSVDNSATTVNWASGNGKITVPEGHDIVVKIDDSGNLADSTSNYLNATVLIE